MIYSLDYIKNKLDEIFLPLEDEIQGMRLVSSCRNISEIDSLEVSLNCKIPDSFKELILKYDFGSFTINNIEFGYQKNFFKLLEKINTASGYNQWWQGEERPKNIILIAISDPYSILLNCETGHIYALLSDDKWFEWRVVSDNFEIFIRCVGTIYINNLEGNKNPELIDEIMSISHSKDKEFWKYLMI